MRYSNLAAIVAASVLFGLPATAQNTAAPADPVVASVNGVKIYRSDVSATHGQLPEQYRKLPIDQVFQPIVNQLIQTKILSVKARADKLDQTDNYKKRMVLIQERLLGEALLAKLIGEKITDDVLRARYEKNSAQYPTKEEIRARHILVKTEDEANDLIKRLVAGADFAKLATENSTGPSKTRGGDLDYIGRGQMVPQFEEAAFALAKGEFTQKPVRSPFGWHVIKVEDKRQSKPPSFEESRAKLGQEVSQEVAAELVKNLMENAKIERFEADGSAPRMRRIQPAPGK
jgi:peptidyl-prolyl cis-trans isomerase C